MGLFDKFKRSLGYQDEGLRETGIRGTGKVLSGERMLLSDDDGHHVYNMTLLVTVPGEQPYEVTYKIEDGFAEGSEYPVYVDPKDRTKMFVDSASPARERVTEALGELSELEKLRGWKQNP